MNATTPTPPSLISPYDVVVRVGDRAISVPAECPYLGRVPRRDYQRSRVYKWERGYWGQESRVLMSLGECATLAGNVLRSMGWDWVEFPRFKDGRGRRRAGATSSWVALPRWSRMEWVVVHELAHTVDTQMRVSGRRRPWHGPVFVRLYVEMMGSLGYCTDEAQDSLDAAGIDVAPYSVLADLEILR